MTFSHFGEYFQFKLLPLFVVFFFSCSSSNKQSNNKKKGEQIKISSIKRPGENLRNQRTLQYKQESWEISSKESEQNYEIIYSHNFSKKIQLFFGKYIFSDVVFVFLSLVSFGIFWRLDVSLHIFRLT